MDIQIKEKTLTTLEFDKIRTILASLCPTRGSAEKALELIPDTHKEIIIKKQTATTDARRLLEAKGMPPFGTVTDIESACDSAISVMIVVFFFPIEPQVIETIGSSLINPQFRASIRLSCICAIPRRNRSKR